MSVNHFKVGSFCLSPLSIRSTMNQYNLMVPQIVLGGWEGDWELRCKAGLSDEFLLLQGGDKRHKELHSQPPSSLSVFSVIYYGWRCCCVTERIQQSCAVICNWGCEFSNLSIGVNVFWFLLVYLLHHKGKSCILLGWIWVFDVAPV